MDGTEPSFVAASGRADRGCCRFGMPLSDLAQKDQPSRAGNGPRRSMTACSAQAKAYQEALLLGAVQLDEVIAWSDGIIAATKSPGLDYIELSLAKTDSVALTHLNALAAGADERAAFSILFGMLHSALRAGRCDIAAVARRLYFWSAYETDLKGFGALISFWDELDIAALQSRDEVDRVRTEFLDFLHANSAQ